MVFFSFLFRIFNAFFMSLLVPFLRRSAVLLLLGSMLVSVIPSAFALQEESRIRLTAPEELRLEQEMIVLVEITDSQGEPLEGADPEISFDPGAAVMDEFLYDCGDPALYDACRANHRGVPGLFEVAFVLIDSPVMIEVSVQGVREGLRLAVGEEETVSSLIAPLAKAALAPPSVTDEVAPASIRVGPSQSFWFISFPFLLLFVIVTYFVLSTKD